MYIQPRCNPQGFFRKHSIYKLHTAGKKQNTKHLFLSRHTQNTNIICNVFYCTKNLGFSYFVYAYHYLWSVERSEASGISCIVGSIWIFITEASTIVKASTGSTSTSINRTTTATYTTSCCSTNTTWTSWTCTSRFNYWPQHCITVYTSIPLSLITKNIMKFEITQNYE